MAERQHAPADLTADGTCGSCGVHWNRCPWCRRWWTGSHSCARDQPDYLGPEGAADMGVL